jgi:putative oxidoreductase
VKLSMLIVRVTVAVLLMVHGIARVSLGVVDDFGGFLETRGFPYGLMIAWGITSFEIVGGLLFMLGIARRVLALTFAVELVVGIVMVHWNSGWFVVGAGRNGIEYSVLLIACLIATALERSPAGSIPSSLKPDRRDFQI